MHTWNTALERASKGNLAPDRRVEKTDAEWLAQLGPDAFRVMRQAGTERAFSSEMCGLHEPSIYECAGCGTPLFDATTKFDSHSGWPSFTQPLKDNVVDYIADDSHGMRRIENTCSTCDGHLGHVFPDGPAPSGLRYCINALSLKNSA